MKGTARKHGGITIRRLLLIWLVLSIQLVASAPASDADLDQSVRIIRSFNFQSVRLAITDLNATHGGEYPNGARYLQELARLEQQVSELERLPLRSERRAVMEVSRALVQLRRDALLANPLLGFNRLLLVKHNASTLMFPRNDACYSSIRRTGYDCEIAVLAPVRPEGKITTLFKAPDGRYLADLELHFGAEKMLFTMSGSNHWHVHEIGVDAANLRQLTSSPNDDVDFFDPCYLPNGKIIFSSTATYQSVPCYNGTRKLGQLYLMDGDGRNVRQLTFDQDDNCYPTVMNNGRVMFSRWEYAGIPHFFSRLMFQMDPDGMGQEELYGSNSYWPNAIYQARSIPDDPTKFVGIVSGHHGDRRMGELILFDPAKGKQEAAGVVQRIPGYGKPVEPIIKDTLVNNSWPKFMQPWPLSDKYFLVSCKPSKKSNWGIYLADVFDNLTLIREVEGFALLEPTPLVARPMPPVIPEKVRPGEKEATVYMVDVYQGAGLKEVPRGTVKSLRVIQPHYGFFGNAGWLNIGIDGPWDVQRILGTVPVHEDGSAYFKIPANTPVSVQPLDAEGKAVQLMRSWFTAMPGETKSCVGCHEGHSAVVPNTRTMALGQAPARLKEWYGPARGFSFERDVQPVLDAQCVSCHHGKPFNGKKLADLRSRDLVAGYEGVLAPVPREMENGLLPARVTMDDVGIENGQQERKQELIKFTPAYEALHRFVRRGGSESDTHLLLPYEYHADTSELVQMLKKGHYGVELDAESWDRLITWIDLNVPCHGTWSEVYPIPFHGRERRRDYLHLYAGIDEDYETIPPLSKTGITPTPVQLEKRQHRDDRPPVRVSSFPFSTQEAVQRQAAAASSCRTPIERRIELGGGNTLHLVLIPAGDFVIGDNNGSEDERPVSRVTIEKPFWIGKFEVRNRDFALFDPSHDSRYISQFNTGIDTRGFPVNHPDQPVVRVSWTHAMAFCSWLSQKTGENFSLPTEAQWEYAARAGSAQPFWYGDFNSHSDKFANLADVSIQGLARRDLGGILHKDHPDWMPRDEHSNDKCLVTATVGSYEANPWGLFDVHGNAAEWTRTSYAPYPYDPLDGRDEISSVGRKVVRGGSWADRARRSTASFRVAYPVWHGIYNVGFRVVCDAQPLRGP